MKHGHVLHVIIVDCTFFMHTPLFTLHPNLYCMHACMHTRAHARTHAHTHTHTYTHTKQSIWLPYIHLPS